MRGLIREIRTGNYNSVQLCVVFTSISLGKTQAKWLLENVALLNKVRDEDDDNDDDGSGWRECALHNCLD